MHLSQWFLTFSLPRSLLSNCPLFQAPLTVNKLYKQMYLLVNFLIKLSMLQSV